ncbi:MAG: hypothetical protein SF053_13695 [Bacteroidia bacterium]|nr:hypothetical protein [Bacteroidia bacterium]
MRYLLSGLLLLTGLAACGPASRTVTPAFYHWKTTLNLTAPEKATLDSLGVKKLYIRLFDITRNAYTGEVGPAGILEKPEQWPSEYEIIPVIYITNEAVAATPADQAMATLSENIIGFATLIVKDIPIREIQIDCDWSESTRERFFQLMAMMQLRLNHEKPGVLLSSTIRLHQVKYYEKTGVPPVNKGTLMLYNMGDVADPGTENSILDLDVTRDYLVNFDKYPLPLDVALPAYGWTVVLRDNKPLKLLNISDLSILETDTARFAPDSVAQRYRVRRSTFVNGFYLYKDDILRPEQVTQEALTQLADLVSPVIRNPNLTVTFYHLTPQTISTYPYVFLEKICRRFRSADPAP